MAGLVVVGQSKVKDAVQKAVTNAVRETSKDLDVDPKEFDQLAPPYGQEGAGRCCAPSAPPPARGDRIPGQPGRYRVTLSACSVSMSMDTASISARWVKACGKFPRCWPVVASISSA